MTPITSQTFVSTHLLAAAYGEGTYSCGQYQVGCSTTSNVQVPDTSTASILSEPSIVIPGSLLLAIIVALITTTIAKYLRRNKIRKSS
jgi:hypothetical protein